MWQHVKSLLEPNSERKYEKTHTGVQAYRTARVRNDINPKVNEYTLMGTTLEYGMGRWMDSAVS